MISLKRPEPYLIRRFLDNQVTKPFSYVEVNATKGELPAGYSINHMRSRLGNGLPVFEAAVKALQAWKQLQVGWVDCWPHNAPLEAGEQIAVLGKALGLWWLNACRIVYTIDERDSDFRYGFAHGTLPDHLAIGEERFLVEMSADADVWLDILSFSRPNPSVAKIGFPLIRRAQQRFWRESGEQIRSAVNRTSDDAPESKADRFSSARLLPFSVRERKRALD